MKSKITLLTAALSLLGYVSFAQYCTSFAAFTGDGRINSVNLAGETTTINAYNAGGCQTYTDNTLLPAADVVLGTAYTVTVQHGTCSSFFGYTRGHKIFIDWNQDGDFEDANEDQGASTFSSATTWTFNHTINVPANAFLGETRMRIVSSEVNQAAQILPCGPYDNGETEDYTIFVTTLNLTAFTPDTLMLDCYNSDDGSIKALAVGLNAAPPFNYLWSTGATTDSIGGLIAGTYSVIITDNNGVMDTSFTEYLAPDTLVADAYLTQPMICDYDISEATVDGSGGTPITNAYVWDTTSANYMWEDGGEAATQVFLSNNQVSVPQDIGFDFVYFGDTFDQFVMASNGFISFNGSSDNGCCDGDAIPNNSNFEPNNAIYAAWDYWTATAFTSNYSYHVTGIAPFRTCVISFEDLPVCCGQAPPRVTAQIKLLETTNCIEIHTEFFSYPGFGSMTQGIENADGDEAYTYPGRNGSNWSGTPDSSSFIGFCPPDENGLTYEWSTGHTGKDIQGLLQGVYDVSVSDKNGCFTVDTLIVEPISFLTDSAMVTDIACFGDNNGMVDPGITGGILPYQFDWNSGQTTATITGLGPGTYSVSAEDNVGCTIEVSELVVHEPALLQAAVNNVVNVNCPGDTNGSATGVAAGGVAPYMYMWSPVNVVGQTASGLGDGNYNFVVTDSNGCKSFASVSVLADNSLPEVDLGPDIFSSEGGEFILDAGLHTAYSWSDGGSSATTTVTESGKYRVTVTNEAGCQATDEVEVEIWPTGVNTLANTGINVYPNPASLMVNIEIETADNASVEIMDVKGSFVKSVSTLKSGVNTIDISDLNAGVYFLNIYNNDAVIRHQLSVTK